MEFCIPAKTYIIVYTIIYAAASIQQFQVKNTRYTTYTINIHTTQTQGLYSYYFMEVIMVVMEAMIENFLCESLFSIIIFLYFEDYIHTNPLPHQFSTLCKWYVYVGVSVCVRVGVGIGGCGGIGILVAMLLHT